MKILITSDLHGRLPKVPEGYFDLFISCGDNCPNYQRNWYEDRWDQLNWITQEFNPWLDQIKASKKIITWGNHDGVGNMSQVKGVIHAESCINETVRFMDEVIFISPFTPDPFDISYWNFKYDPSPNCKVHPWDMIPEDVTILVTHGPAYNILDVDTSRLSGTRIGCPILGERISALKNLKIHCFGHCHYPLSDRKYVDGSLRLNASQQLMEVEI